MKTCTKVGESGDGGKGLGVGRGDGSSGGSNGGDGMPLACLKKAAAMGKATTAATETERRDALGLFRKGGRNGESNDGGGRGRRKKGESNDGGDGDKTGGGSRDAAAATELSLT